MTYDDLIESMELVLTALKGEVLTDQLIETIKQTLFDAVDNNS